MKNRNKIILGAALAISPIAIVTPLILTSCSKDNYSTQDNLSKTYQYDYSKNISLLLGDNVVSTPSTYGTQSYLSFKDSSTQAWYLLMRDTNNNSDRIIASFCGWDINYYKSGDGKKLIDGTYSIPNTIAIPNGYNLNIKGVNKNAIPVEAIGFKNDMVTNSYLRTDVLFPNIEDDSTNNLPYLPIVNSLDLQNNNIKYIFDRSSFYFANDRTSKENSKIIFPESLIYLGESNTIGSNISFTNLELDFSFTKLVEISYLRVTIKNDGNLKIKLPSSCIRISNIVFTDLLDINLENVLYYRDYALWGCKFSNNTVKINKNAQYFGNTFSGDVIIEFFE